MSRKLIVFVRAPRPGGVKTRLASAIGACAAVQAYVRLVETLLVNLSPLEEVELRFAPDEAREEIEPWRRAGWQCRAQGEGDLGARLQRAFAEAFAEGCERMVVIGSDCPTVTAADIHAAWDALASHDLVLGPATDGGYWLIGLRKPQEALFDGMPWSTERVLEATLELADALGLRVWRLNARSDVDTEADWREFLRSRALPIDRCPEDFGCEI